MDPMRSPGLVVLKGRLWLTPTDPHLLQCVARTAKGKRCQNLVESGQVLSWCEVQLGPHGYVNAYDGRRWDDADRWLAQHCRTHDGPHTDDLEHPEFRSFHVHADAAHLRPYRQDAVYDA
jgi:hypothetical protein